MAVGAKKVCVTGANGFIGSWLVRTLLEKGYAVNGTYQKGTDTSHLLSLPNANVRLSLFEADLLDAPALQAAIDGCSGVFHVASPCTLSDPRDPHLELILPAVQGTLNVLEASRTSKVSRVVITSSISALVPNPNWPHSTAPIDENSWTDIEYCKSRQKWYPVSKTMAEKAAWDYAEKHGIDIVTVHPSTVLGPLLQKGLNASSAVLLNLLQGSMDTQEYHWLGCVHVRDVANAHVLSFEKPSASGRYLCTNGIYQFRDFAAKVAELCPEYPVHSEVVNLLSNEGECTRLCNLVAAAINFIAFLSVHTTPVVFHNGNGGRNGHHRYFYDMGCNGRYGLLRFAEETQPGLMDCKDAAKKLIDLGLVFTPIEKTIQDAVASLKANGLLGLPNQQP